MHIYYLLVNKRVIFAALGSNLFGKRDGHVLDITMRVVDLGCTNNWKYSKYVDEIFIIGFYINKILSFFSGMYLPALFVPFYCNVYFHILLTVHFIIIAQMSIQNSAPRSNAACGTNFTSSPHYYLCIAQ